MATKYVLEDVTCISCAAAIERKLKDIEGIEFSSINVGSSNITFSPDLETAVKKTVKGIEPGARLIRSDATGDSTHDDGQRRLKSAVIRILVATALFVAGLFVDRFLRTQPRLWIRYAVFLSPYLLVGWPVLAGAIKSIVRGRVFSELFLMSLATVGAIIIGELPEAVGVMLFYSIGTYLEERAVIRSRRSIKSLMDLRPDQSRIVTENGTELVPSDSVAVGSIVEVRPGEKLPLDGTVVEGESGMDTSSITGESRPKLVETGDEAMAGYLNGEGRLRIETTRLFDESSAAKILHLVENAASRKARTEHLLSKIAAIYTPVVVAIALLVAFVPPLFFAGNLQDWIYRALVILVISCPCALVVSIPLGYFGGIGKASKNGILVKGSNVLDSLKRINTIIFDKTGTLTEGEFGVRDVVAVNGYSEAELLETAATVEASSNHPIAKSIFEAYGKPLREVELASFREEKGLGIMAEIGTKRVFVGSAQLLEREGIEVERPASAGTVVHVAFEKNYAGYLLLDDNNKVGAAAAIEELRSMGVGRQIMLSGDEKERAAVVAEQLNLDDFRGGLLPEQKVEFLEQALTENGDGLTAFVGDGINDSPAIARADVGFAMGGLGTDAAIEAADVVIMDDDISKIPAAMRTARQTRTIVLQNILFALSFKSVFLLLGAFGISSMWIAVIADVGVALLAVLNSTRLSLSKRN